VGQQRRAAAREVLLQLPLNAVQRCGRRPGRDHDARDPLQVRAAPRGFDAAINVRLIRVSKLPCCRGSENPRGSQT